MSNMTKRQILQLIEKYLDTEEAHQQAVRACSCYPSLIIETQQIKSELISVIESELHSDGRKKL